MGSSPIALINKNNDLEQFLPRTRPELLGVTPGVTIHKAPHPRRNGADASGMPGNRLSLRAIAACSFCSAHMARRREEDAKKPAYGCIGGVVMAKQASRQSTKNYCLFAVITVSLAIAASLFTFELALRLFPPVWLKHRMDFLSLDRSDARFGNDAAWKVQMPNGEFWRYEPNSEFIVKHYEHSHIAHIDELGGRSVIHRRDKSKAALLPFLGDSFTFGVGVSDEEAFSNVLSGEIQDLRIINLGVPGTALGDQLKIVALRHAELGRPMKYVFFFFLGNDFSDLLKPAGHAKRDAENLNSGPDSRRDQNLLWYVNDVVNHNAVLKNSYLIQFARMPVVYFMMRRQSGVDSIFFIMDATGDQFYRRAQIALNLQLDILVQMQRELKFSSMIVAIPDRHQINEILRRMNAAKYGYDDKILDPHRPNLLLKNSVLTRGITFFDSTECLATIDNPANLYYSIDDHFTAAGHKNFAGCVASPLKKFVYE
jgi:lysophospholipase L1-like esterase